MTFLYYLVVVLHILACLFLIGVVLLQQGKSQDLASAFGGGGTQTAFGPRGSANVLSRATTILAGLFMVTSLALSMLRPRASSILDRGARRRRLRPRRRRASARRPRPARRAAPAADAAGRARVSDAGSRQRPLRRPRRSARLAVGRRRRRVGGRP